jgi:hypothetical protein
MMSKEQVEEAEKIGLRICKNCFRIKSHLAYKGSSRVCRVCKGQPMPWEEKNESAN